MISPMETWVTVADAVKETAVSKTRIYTAVNNGRVRSRKVDGVTEVALEDVQAIEDTRGTESDGDHLQDAIRVMGAYSAEALKLVTEPNRHLLGLFNSIIEQQRKEIESLTSRLVELSEQSSRIALERFQVEREADLELARLQASEKKWNGFVEGFLPMANYFFTKKEARSAILKLDDQTVEGFVQAIREMQGDDAADSLKEYFSSIRNAKGQVSK